MTYRAIVHSYGVQVCKLSLPRQPVAYSILNIQFSHQQMHFFIKKHIKIYFKIHINIAPTCFGLACCSMLPHNRTINNDVISPNVLTQI